MYKRYVDIGNFFINNITGSGSGLVFTLDQVPGYTEFTNLYDFYKLNAVKLTFYPQMTQNISLGSVNNANASARFFSVIDLNDATAPTSSNDLREYSTCRMTPILRRHSRFLKPRIQDADKVYTPGRPWLYTSSPSIKHFGLKIFVEPMGSTSTTDMEYKCEAKFYLSFKSVK